MPLEATINDVKNKQKTTIFRLGFIGDPSTTVNGLNITGMAAEHESVNGIDIGFSGHGFKEINGVQVRGINMAQSVRGVSAGLVGVYNHSHGVVANLFNFVQESYGLSIGFFGGSERNYGINANILRNNIEDNYGIQICAGWNAGNNHAARIGTVNLAKMSDGLDLGIIVKSEKGTGLHAGAYVEATKKFTGIQIGVVCKGPLKGNYTQLGVVTIRDGEGPWYKRTSPLMGFHRDPVLPDPTTASYVTALKE